MSLEGFQRTYLLIFKLKVHHFFEVILLQVHRFCRCLKQCHSEIFCMPCSFTSYTPLLSQFTVTTKEGKMFGIKFCGGCDVMS